MFQVRRLAAIVSVSALASLASLASVAISGCAEAIVEEESGEATGAVKSSGSVLTVAEIAADLRAAGFAEDMIGKMACVAKYESSFNERASNGSHFGLFQIATAHLGSTKGCPETKEELFDGAKNAKCAFGVFKAQGLKAWTVYAPHKSECDNFAVPAGGPSVGSPSSSAADEDEPISPSNPALNADDPSAGGCWSNTMQLAVVDGTCVQSAKSSTWFQCSQGLWSRSTATSGPLGRCVESFPL